MNLPIEHTVFQPFAADCHLVLIFCLQVSLWLLYHHFRVLIHVTFLVQPFLIITTFKIVWLFPFIQLGWDFLLHCMHFLLTS